MGLARPRHEESPAEGPCVDCDCAGMPAGSSGAAFCIDCGHAADAHRPPVTSGCGEGDCACPEFDGPAAAKFCRGCGHAAAAHAGATQPHLTIVETIEDEATTEPEAIAEPAATTSVALPAVHVTVNTGDQATSAPTRSERPGASWIALAATTTFVTLAAVVVVLALQWRAGERRDMAAAAERRATDARRQLAIEQKLDTDLAARIARKQDDLEQLAARRAKLDAGPKVVGSVAQARARRDYFARQVDQRESTLAAARANADGAIGTVRGW